MTQMLASVTSTAEALLALELGADIIDVKNPSDGALGALPLATIRDIVEAIDRRRLISATIGDYFENRSLVAERVFATATTGVDIVKIGIESNYFERASRHGIAWLGGLATASTSTNLVAVLFADQQPEFAWIDVLGQQGFHGIMLDTFDKYAGNLRTHLLDEQLCDFVRRAHFRQLACGLAGSLRLGDIPPLIAIAPDYLGFRGALCRNSARTEQLDAHAFRLIRAGIPTATSPSEFTLKAASVA